MTNIVRTPGPPSWHGTPASSRGDPRSESREQYCNMVRVRRETYSYRAGAHNAQIVRRVGFPLTSVWRLSYTRGTVRLYGTSTLLSCCYGQVPGSLESLSDSVPWVPGVRPVRPWPSNPGTHQQSSNQQSVYLVARRGTTHRPSAPSALSPQRQP